MSSVFSRKIVMSTLSGALTGEGTPLNQRTGRRQTYRSSIWRSATLSERMPPPTGVVSGPLIETRYSRQAATVSSGSQLLNWRFDFSPANTSIQWILRRPPYAFCTAASMTRTLARQMSGPVPSPSMKGMMGFSGTRSLPSCMPIFAPCGGGVIFELASVDIEGALLEGNPGAGGAGRANASTGHRGAAGPYRSAATYERLARGRHPGASMKRAVDARRHRHQ